MEALTTANVEAGEAFVSSLYETIIGAGDKSLLALEELSNIALGGHEQAKKLINEIDGKVSAGELVLPKVDKVDRP